MKPFLKWPGNKQKIANIILDKILVHKTTQDMFVEPFAGSCAMSLSLVDRDNVDDIKYYKLNDANSDLINSYRQISFTTEINDIIDALKSEYFIPENNVKEKYIEFRAKYNTKEDISYFEELCLLIYLNRHCFNGLVRYNKSGKFNVPFGRYPKINVPEKDLKNFYAFAHRGNKNQNVEFLDYGFENYIQYLLNTKINNSIVYCDPPYFPLSKTSNFVDYLQIEGTNWISSNGSQKKLVDFAEKLTSNKEQNNIVAISNHDVPEFRELTKNAKEYHLIEAKRSISANKESRKTIKEALAIYV